jgi:uncharacterized protein
MRTVIGSPVEGDDFFDREPERRRMWRRLETDSLLLLADGAALGTDLVDQVFDDLLNPTHKGYFDYWRQRLTEELGRPDDAYAIHLLNYCARDPKGASRTVLDQALAERIAEPDAREDRLRYLLDILESDGYLVQADGRRRFRLELLRRYWLKRVAP